MSAAAIFPTSSSDLAYLDWQSERLVERAILEPQFARLSIRHLALTEAGDVAAALQDSADVPNLDFPLGFLHRAGGQPRWLAAPQGGWGRLRGYCGAAAVDSAAGLIAMSSPRGNCIGLWDETGSGSRSVRDPRWLRPQRHRRDGAAAGIQRQRRAVRGDGRCGRAVAARRQRRVPLRQSHDPDLDLLGLQRRRRRLRAEQHVEPGDDDQRGADEGIESGTSSQNR